MPTLLMFLIDGAIFFECERPEHINRHISFGERTYSRANAILVTPILISILKFIIVAVVS